MLLGLCVFWVSDSGNATPLVPLLTLVYDPGVLWE